MGKAKQVVEDKHTVTAALVAGKYVVTDVLTGTVLYKGTSKAKADTIYAKAMSEYARMKQWGWGEKA